MSGLNISFKISAIDDFSNTMSSLNKETKKAFDTVGNLGAGFTAAGAGVALGLGYAVKTATDFEAQMSRVSAISGASGEQLEALRDTALDLGASTSKSASEVAVGMEEMAKKGFEVNEVMAAMPGIISASEASGEDLALVSNVVASALNSFGLEATEASRVADVMATAANKSSADVNDLGYAFKYAAPIANTLGYSMETLAAATGIMTDAGLEGSQAGTTLRMAMIRLSDPPKEAAKEINKLGLNLTDAAGNMLPFDQIIQQLAESTSGMGNAAKLAALSQIFGAEAASGMLTIIDAGPEKLRKFTAELQNSEGASQKTAAAMKDNLKGAIQELQGSFETLMITMGTALTPAIQAVTEVLTSLVNWFNGLPAPLQTALTVMIALTAALLLIAGPILMLVAMLPSIVAGFGAIAGAVGLTAGALAGVIGIILGVVAVLAAIGVGLVIAYNKVGWFRDMVNSAWASIVSAWNTALTFISGIVQTVMTVVSAFIGEKLAQIKSFWDQNGVMIMQAVSNVWNVIKTIITGVMTGIMAVMQFIWPVIKLLIVSTWEAIKGVIDGALKIILGVVKAFAALFTGNWSALWDAIKQIFVGILQFLWNFISLMFVGKIIGVAKTFASLMRSLITSMWSTIRNIFTSSVGAVRNVISSGFNFIKSFVSNTLGTIKSVVTSVWNGIKSVVASVINAIKSFVTNGFNAMKSAISNVMNSVKNVIQTGWNNAKSFLTSIDLRSVGKNIIQGLINGIGSMAGSLMDKAKSIANSVTDTIKGAFDINSPSRVMNKEVGRWIPPGIADGILGSMDVVKKAAGAVVQAAIPPMPKLSTPNYSAQRVSTGAQLRPSVTNHTPISITLHYNGSASRDDVLTMADLLDVELANRMAYQARISGVKGV